MPLHIDGPESGRLSNAIKDACPSPKTLREVLKVKLDAGIWDCCGFDDEYPDIRFKLIFKFNAQWRIDKLVAALLEHAPDNGLLLEFAWRHNIVKRPAGSNGKVQVDDNVLEGMLDKE